MSGVLGFDLQLGPQVARPGHDPGETWVDCTQARTAWVEAIDQAVRDEDAWGLLCTAPDGAVTLRDVLTPGSVWAATAAYSVHLLTAREALP